MAAGGTLGFASAAGPVTSARAISQYSYSPMPPDDPRGEPERPEYKVYRSRPGLLSRLRAPDLSKLRRGDKGGGDKPPGEGRTARERGEPAGGPRPWTWQRVLKWVGIAALGWIVISIVAFAIS